MNNSLTVGAFEAKTKFSELLERVSHGEEITITKHEKPVARLVPFEKPSQVELAALFRQMEDFRAKHPLNPQGLEKVSYRELVDGGPQTMSHLVIDASMALSWLLPDEATDASVAVQAKLIQAESVWVAAHWRLEVANSLCMAERRKRLDAAGIAQAVALFTQLPVIVDPETNDHASAETLSLARQHTLSVYDAAYLELALRRGAALASFDGPLRVVAKKLGVPLLPKKVAGE